MNDETKTDIALACMVAGAGLLVWVLCATVSAGAERETETAQVLRDTQRRANAAQDETERCVVVLESCMGQLEDHVDADQ